jgi:NAD-dependent deacetylase
VTQNVDGLHGRAGSKNVVELHGNLTRGRCKSCGTLEPLALEMPLPPVCPACGGRMRPNVVWFGERLPEGALSEAHTAFSRAEVALIVGTSGVVEPAASLGQIALWGGAQVTVINPEPTPAERGGHAVSAAGRGLRTRAADVKSLALAAALSLS